MKTHQQHLHLKSIFRTCHEIVSSFALKKILQHMQLFNLSAKTANTVLRSCTDQVKMSMKLSCAHIIQKCLKTNKSLDSDYFNIQWHLEQGECLLIDYHHLVQDPEKVQP